MDLFVVRHAEAIPRREGIEDAERTLTAKGLARWQRAVRGLARLRIQLDRVYHSPRLRAAQTAEALTALLRGDTVATLRLAEQPNNVLLAEISGKRVALVGHEPWVGELVSWLVLGRAEAGWIELKKGSVVWLEGDLKPGAMRLRALLPPKALRRLGR